MAVRRWNSSLFASTLVAAWLLTPQFVSAQSGGGGAGGTGASGSGGAGTGSTSSSTASPSSSTGSSALGRQNPTSSTGIRNTDADGIGSSGVDRQDERIRGRGSDSALGTSTQSGVGGSSPSDTGLGRSTRDSSLSLPGASSRSTTGSGIRNRDAFSADPSGATRDSVRGGANDLSDDRYGLGRARDRDASSSLDSDGESDAGRSRDARRFDSDTEEATDSSDDTFRNDSDDDENFDMDDSGTASSSRERGPSLGMGVGGRSTRGVRVTRVLPRGPAAEAGLQAGDIVVAIDNRRVRDARDVSEELSQRDADDEVVLLLIRGNERIWRTATLASHEEVYSDSSSARDRRADTQFRNRASYDSPRRRDERNNPREDRSADTRDDSSPDPERSERFYRGEVESSGQSEE